jgi:rare lipoprotein A
LDYREGSATLGEAMQNRPFLRRYFYLVMIIPMAGFIFQGSAAAAGHSRHDRSKVQVGIASWYGREHQGRLTASGRRFDRRKLTAAHNTLPFHTKAKVTNLENGKSVEVTINDRGPGVRGRVIDLSERAALRLGMKQAGLARVKIEPLPRAVAYD